MAVVFLASFSVRGDTSVRETASFIYDALGRRMSKSIAGSTTKFLYDGLNPAQELDASNSSNANLLTGGRLDEYLQRSD